ncbi:hypothetical protein LK996_15580 [Lysobacter sp. A6]|uniref:Uncharacterized protein n=1 Tax=Noviluteimonas lactosilytica TaxID=2888523 RepID=A0ABS8JLQ8_9GAMM|nr:hypothetical protein [Lysobacter lactosilyticus]MCC8364492.1 hypothetical protein [Lysobacter lactosilyticus]
MTEALRREIQDWLTNREQMPVREERRMDMAPTDDENLLSYARHAQAGNLWASNFLYRQLIGQLLGLGERKELTPVARRILARMLLRVLRGRDVEKAMLRKRTRGNQRWVYIDRDFEIDFEMRFLVGDPIEAYAPIRQGIFSEPDFRLTESDAAAELERSGIFPGLDAKTILNIYQQMKVDPRLPE